MANIIIKDTGYANRDRVLNGSLYNRANSGSAINMPYSFQLSYEESSNVEHSAVPGRSTSSEANSVTTENPVFRCSVSLHYDDSDDQDLAQAILGQLRSETNPSLARSRGIKVMYISGTSDTRKTVLELIGQTDTEFHGEEIPSGLPAVVGYVKNLTATQSDNSNKLTISFNFVEG